MACPRRMPARPRVRWEHLASPRAKLASIRIECSGQAGGNKRSGPVGRILCIGYPTWQPFLWAARYRNGSLPPTRRLARAALSQGPKALLRLPIWCCSGWRLPRFTSTRLAPRLLVSVVLFVASPRTAVSRHPALWSPDLPHRVSRPTPARLPGPLRTCIIVARRRSGGAQATRLQARVCPASRGTMSPSTYDRRSGMRWGARRRVIWPGLRGRP